MKVVLAEKPSQGRDYAKVLGCTEKHNGYITGNGYTVTWAIGHLVSMDRPQEMGQAKNMSDLPVIKETPGFRVVEDKKSQFSVIESLFNDPDTEEIICGTDAGREGEHIFRLIYDQAGCTKPVKRLWISSLTPAALKKGFDALRPGDDYKNLAAAAMCRAKADMHVGLNFSIAHSIHNRQKVTTGRVQTPTLAIVAQRELDIKNFKSNFYYEILADLDGFKAKYVNSEGKHAIEDKAAAQTIFDGIKNAKIATVIKREGKTKSQKAPALYSLLTLQVDANKLFGLTADQTLKIAQSLYESRKLISYPRTESNHLSTDMVDGLPDIIKNLPDLCGNSVDTALDRLNDGLSLGKGYVDDTKLTDHHAIIPTGEAATIDDLSMDERNLYLLVCERFLSIFLPECVSEITKVDLSIEDQIFRTSGSIITDPGWRSALIINKAKTEKTETLPDLEENQAIDIKKIDLDKKKTKPPARFNDASLLKAMKAAGKMVDDKDLASYMKENGIGTSATRGGIIEKLMAIGYLAREKKAIIPTDKGLQRFLSELPELKSPKLTGEWEQKLKLIESGEYDPDKFDQEIESFIKKLIPQVEKTKKIERASFGTCPVCGKGEIIDGGKGFGCSEYNNGCKFVIWKNIAGKIITADHVRQLLEGGKTAVIVGFKSKAGKKFDAFLELRDGEVKMVFEQINCPSCESGKIIEGKKCFGCSGYKDGCKFVIWKNIAGKTITKAQVKTLIEKGKSGLITGFKSKAGKKFDAYLIMKEGKIEFEFPKRTKGKSSGSKKSDKRRTKQRGARR